MALLTKKDKEYFIDEGGFKFWFQKWNVDETTKFWVCTERKYWRGVKRRAREKIRSESNAYNERANNRRIGKMRENVNMLCSFFTYCAAFNESTMTFEQHKILINSSPEREKIFGEVTQRFRSFREHISKLDIKEVKHS
jgi:hypothetical protein